MPYLKLSFILTFIIYVLILVFFTLRLGGDDWQQLQYVSGTFISDEPAEFLLYTHVSIGLLLKFYTYIAPILLGTLFICTLPYSLLAGVFYLPS